jgi:predicted kinase
MDILDKEKVKLLIKDYGPLEVLREIREAMRECADEYSDEGLKERAYEAAEVAELLSEVNDIAGSGSPVITDDIV